MGRVASYDVKDINPNWWTCGAANCGYQATHEVTWVVSDGAKAGARRRRRLCDLHTGRWLDTHFVQSQLFPT